MFILCYTFVSPVNLCMYPITKITTTKNTVGKLQIKILFKPRVDLSKAVQKKAKSGKPSNLARSLSSPILL